LSDAENGPLSAGKREVQRGLSSGQSKEEGEGSGKSRAQLGERSRKTN